MALNRDFVFKQMMHKNWRTTDLYRAMVKHAPEDSKLNPSLVYHWLHKDVEPSADYLSYIAKALDCKITDVHKEPEFKK